MGVGGLYNGSAYSTDASPCTGYTAIAGYWPGSDVTEHNKIDLDQHAITTSLKSGDFVSAKTMYTTGANSQGSNGFRTLQGFSTSAQAKMYEGCAGCPYEHYSRFFNYYGDYNYADKWVLAALDGASTGFPNVRGNADFNIVDDVATRTEAVKKGTAYMNVWMYVIREFEDAIDDCLTCTSNCNEHSNYNSVHAWDEGVAFYTGSLEGTDLGGTSAGEMPYRLAEKRCANFKTCGSKGDSTTGISKVNNDLFELFLEGEMQLSSGSDDGPKAKAEGAVFAASVLPLVNHCNPGSASTIFSNMRVGASSTTWSDVKSAFESNYACLGISCAEVGGLWDGSTYSAFASPCSEEVATLDSAVTITSNQAPEYFDKPDVRARMISEYARKVGVSESAVNFVVKQSASRLRARSLQVATSYNIVFTITCQASCDAVAASVPSTQSEATAVFDAANVDAEALSDPVQTLPSPPPPSPPSPPTTSDCLGTGNTNIPPPPPPPLNEVCKDSDVAETHPGVVAGLAICGLLALSSVVFVAYLISRERHGKPIFLSLGNGSGSGKVQSVAELHSKV